MSVRPAEPVDVASSSTRAVSFFRLVQQDKFFSANGLQKKAPLEHESATEPARGFERFFVSGDSMDVLARPVGRALCRNACRLCVRVDRTSSTLRCENTTLTFLTEVHGQVVQTIHSEE